MYKRILVPVDGSACSNKALVCAQQLARDFGSQVRLVHLMEELNSVTGYDYYEGYSGELITMMREAGTKVLDDAVAIAHCAGIEAQSTLVETFGERLGEIIAHEAGAWKADLVVAGSHGRRGLGRLLTGSGAEQIVRLSSVPVMVVRSNDRANHSNIDK